MLKISADSTHHPLHRRRRNLKIPLGTQRFLAAFEGIEGGFAVGASILVALSIAGLDKEILLMTVVVSIVVSGFNSASVKYSSEHYLDELDGREKRDTFRHYFIPSAIEFLCYVILSLFCVLPILVIPSQTLAVVATVAVTLLLLFCAGAWRGYVLRMNIIKDGIETASLGFGITAIGLISGIIVNSLS